MTADYGISTLNEGRSISSGDTRDRRATGRWSGLSLNEGRSISSGDTPAGTMMVSPSTLTAQRRPEHKLRRHVS